jgi:hypothetical protein
MGSKASRSEFRATGFFRIRLSRREPFPAFGRVVNDDCIDGAGRATFEDDGYGMICRKSNRISRTATKLDLEFGKRDPKLRSVQRVGRWSLWIKLPLKFGADPEKLRCGFRF